MEIREKNEEKKVIGFEQKNISLKTTLIANFRKNRVFPLFVK